MLRKVLILCLVAVGIAVSVRTLYAQTQKFSSLQCEVITEDSEVGSSAGKFFIKGNKVRMEINMPGQQGLSLINLSNGEKAYTYFPSQNTAMSMPLAQAKQQFVSSDFSQEFNKKNVGEEIVDGRLCDIYEINNPQGGTYKVWVAKDIKFPVKVDMGKMKIYYKNIQVNTTIEDSLFELPSGVQVQEMGTVLKQQSIDRR